MNPFLEVPIGTVIREGESIQAVRRIRPGEVESYFPAETEGCVVVMKSGNMFQTSLEMPDMDQAIYSYAEYVKKNPGKFGNLVINIPKTDAVKIPKMEVIKPEPVFEPGV